MSDNTITIGLAGDVMIGRGVNTTTTSTIPITEPAEALLN